MIKQKHLLLIATLCLGFFSLTMTIFMVHNMAYWHDWVSRNQASSLHTYVVNDILRHACTWSTAALIAAWLSTLFFFWQWKSHKHKTTQTDIPTTVEDEMPAKTLTADLENDCIIYQGSSKKCRHQVVVLLNHLLKSENYTIAYDELNHIFGEKFYDGTTSSQKKANNLKYELKKALEGTHISVNSSFHAGIQLEEET